MVCVFVRVIYLKHNNRPVYSAPYTLIVALGGVSRNEPLVVRADVGFSDEGGAVQMTIDQPF